MPFAKFFPRMIVYKHCSHGWKLRPEGKVAICSAKDVSCKSLANFLTFVRRVEVPHETRRNRPLSRKIIHQSDLVATAEPLILLVNRHAQISFTTVAIAEPLAGGAQHSSFRYTACTKGVRKCLGEPMGEQKGTIYITINVRGYIEHEMESVGNNIVNTSAPSNGVSGILEHADGISEGIPPGE
ncbi:hypothetical protein B0H19DRAFT_1079817 [Mycena capillaripes]|nr:hypothetical protein B0H19DRAFT_1079817 [Mycena capillaripes]